MEEIRKLHNTAKRELIQKTCKVGSRVLDVGAGRGGDLSKWKSRSPSHLVMCDPHGPSLDEARERSMNLRVHAKFYRGDIRQTPCTYFDIICYNFSMQYIYKHKMLFYRTIDEIVRRSQSGTQLIGCIPDSEKILDATPYNDELGNYITRDEEHTGMGNFGESIDVYLADTLYYSMGSIKEPLAYKDILITTLENRGFTLIQWDPLPVSNTISSLYSSFIFVYN